MAETPEQIAWEALHYREQEILKKGDTIKLTGAEMRERGIPLMGLAVVNWDAQSDEYELERSRGGDQGDDRKALRVNAAKAGH